MSFVCMYLLQIYQYDIYFTPVHIFLKTHIFEQVDIIINMTLNITSR